MEVIRLLAAQYGTVSDIEIVWTLIAACGLVFAIFNLNEAFKDWRELGPRLNGLRQIASLSLKLEATRVVIQSIFVAIGLMAMTLKDPPDQLDLPWRVVAVTAMFRWGLVTSALLVMYQSFANFQARRVMRATLALEREAREANVVPLSDTTTDG